MRFIENMNSTIAANEIAGIPKRKENLAASLLSHPDRSAVEIVTPDLETPGIIANAWEKPINKLLRNVWFLMLINLVSLISAKYIKKAITKDIIAIDKLERKTVLKKFGINNLINPPRKIIEIVPIKIDLVNFDLKKELKLIFEVRFLKVKISFLKYQNIAKTLPIWIIADKDCPGSSIPIRLDITFKWAVLLTGINSVRPWIIPYKINFIYSKKPL